MLPDLPEAPVSRETSEKLDSYHAMLLKWQKAINLVSPSTLAEAKIRHFEDSLQIAGLVSGKVYDIGSGAGFPGLVLANFADVHLIESDQRKCQFMKTVSREADIPVTIHNARVENVDLIPPDFITARALASLDQLLLWTEKWWSKNKKIKMVLLKGEKVEKEISEAKTLFNFEYELFQSKTDANGRILILTNINRIP